MIRRSISLKLTLAFLVVGILGAALVAVYVGVRTRSELNRLVRQQESLWIVGALTEYYVETGSWRGINEVLQQRPGRGPMMGGMGGAASIITVANENGIVVTANMHRARGSRLSRPELRAAVRLEADNRIIGYVLLEGPGATPLPNTPEATFLDRVRTAILLSGTTAAVAALVVGGLLTRALMRPIHALTEATQDIANGQLGRQVVVEGEDELGELAVAFNRMSTDLAHTSEMRRQMTADIAHDLRTPLSILMGYTEALSDGKFQGGPEIYAIMHRETQHLDRLITDLRLLSLVDAGELSLNQITMAPATLLERAAAAHLVQAQEQNVQLTVLAPDDLPAVSVDPERMAQVLNNLLINALRYTPEGGTITLRAEPRPQQHQVALIVEDTGSGIAPDDLPRVFDRFYRADLARATSGESGLGLAIVKSLVEAHGGTVGVESTLHRGTTFVVMLPSL